MYSFVKAENRVRSNKVTKWFHTSVNGDITPAQSACEVSDLFLSILHSKQLSLSVPVRLFRKIVCEATCVLKLTSGYELPVPNRVFSRPDGWNGDLERWWTEWLHSHFFVEGFWSRFWNRIYVSEWEDAMPSWRHEIQSLLPYYVQRNTDVLIECGFIIENDDGVFVANEDYDYEAPADYDIYYS